MFVLGENVARKTGLIICPGSSHLLSDHAHMLISISPKYAVSQVVGVIKGMIAIYLARTNGGQKLNYSSLDYDWRKKDNVVVKKAGAIYLAEVGADEMTHDRKQLSWENSGKE